MIFGSHTGTWNTDPHESLLFRSRIPLDRPAVENVRLWAVIVRKTGLDVEFLAFAPGGRPAVFWTRALAEGWLQELRRQRVIADGYVEMWQIKR